MKLHKDCLIEKVLSKDATRHAITETYLDTENGSGSLIATNGKALAVIPVELEEGDVAGYVVTEGIKQARKADKRAEFPSMKLNGNLKLSNGVEMPRSTLPTGTEFPKWRQVIPKDEGYAVEFAFDAKLLYELAQAMGSDGVVIRYKADREPLLVRPTALAGCTPCIGAKGVLMPVRIL